VPPTTAGKIATGIAGVTGTSSLGITAAALTRIASAQAVPTGVWVVLAWLSTTTVAVAGLGLVLDYERAKLEITARAGVVRSRADLEAARLAVYRGLVEKSAEAAGTAASYRDLVLADALHLAVEQNGVRPADRTHGRLYQARSEARPALREASE
jgi:hypothetical protein